MAPKLVLEKLVVGGGLAGPRLMLHVWARARLGMSSAASNAAARANAGTIRRLARPAPCTGCAGEAAQSGVSRDACSVVSTGIPPFASAVSRLVALIAAQTRSGAGVSGEHRDSIRIRFDGIADYFRVSNDFDR